MGAVFSFSLGRETLWCILPGQSPGCFTEGFKGFHRTTSRASYKERGNWIPEFQGMQDWRKLWKLCIDDGTTVPSHCAMHDSSSPFLSSFVYPSWWKEHNCGQQNHRGYGVKWKKFHILEIKSEKLFRKKNILLGSYMPEHRQVQLKRDESHLGQQTGTSWGRSMFF